MNTNEQVVAIAGQLYSMRKIARDVLGADKFRERVEALRPLFERVRKENNCTTMEAMQLILKTSLADNPVGNMLVCAVAIEIIEPSLPVAATAQQGSLI